MNIFNLVKTDILKIVGNFVDADIPLNNITIEAPKDSSHGDLSTNAAMVLSRFAKMAPRSLAEKIVEQCVTLDYVETCEIAGPGFINFRINADLWRQNVLDIIERFDEFVAIDLGQGSKVNIEYVSANPTGPLHIGHARCAVFGDALASLLQATGYDVTKEYYINDAGGQIQVLVSSALLRYREAITGQSVEIPEGLYPGSYLVPAGQALANKHGDLLLNKTDEEAFAIVREDILAAMMKLVTNNLAELDVKHDVFVSEAALHKTGLVEEAVAELKGQDLIYEGQLEAPKGGAPEGWESRSQTLFKSTDFGDDQDRALAKPDGSWTYFASDLAYAKNKIARGFDQLILVLGADHGGYVKRLNAATKALSGGKVKSDIKLCQLVNFVENGQPIKMSKRAGNFTTVHDVINEMGSDIVRFIMLSRKNDAVLDFDLVKLKEQNKDNPVFYVQYAIARGNSILNGAKERIQEAHTRLDLGKINVSKLLLPEEMELVKLLASWPKFLESAAAHAEPHRITFFMQQLAAQFHSMWNLGKLNNEYRFIIEDDVELTTARLALIKAMLNILKHGCKIIGVSAPEKM